MGRGLRGLQVPACARCATAGLVTTSPNPQRGDARRLPRPLRNGGGPLASPPRLRAPRKGAGGGSQKAGDGHPAPGLSIKQPGGHLRLHPAPPRPLPGAALAASTGTGTGPGGGRPRAPQGREQSPGIAFFFFFFGRPRACCPPLPFFFFSCAPLPVLLPRWGAELQLNQCSANNLPANKAFSSLSSSPPLHPNPRVMGAL